MTQVTARLPEELVKSINAAAKSLNRSGAEIDLEDWKIVRLLEAGREPDGMAYSALKIEKD